MNILNESLQKKNHNLVRKIIFNIDRVYLINFIYTRMNNNWRKFLNNL